MKDSSRINQVLDDFIPDFKKTIAQISIDKIEINELNPRKKFGQEEEDELIESINSKGVLQPIIVFEKKEKGKYVLLDGQRRLQACKKIGIKKIPAHILLHEPSEIENLSIMFHIHNVHENWTDLAVANVLYKIMPSMGINRSKITQEDIRSLKRVTSLSVYKIKKYLNVLKYPQSVIDRFLASEIQENPDLDLDLLSELSKPLKKISKVTPRILDQFSEEQIVDILIDKKKNKIIKTNKEIRYLSKILKNASSGKINLRLAEDKILEFLENGDISLEEIYSVTSEAVEQSSAILKISDKLIAEIDNIDLRKIPREDKSVLLAKLQDLINSIKRKM